MENSVDLEKYRKAYERGEPLIPDSVYDKLTGGNDDWLGSIPNKSRYTHKNKMMSLNKYYDEDVLPDWVENKKVVVTPKLDGVACSVYYKHGKLLCCVTRGDGSIGRIINNVNILVPDSVSDGYQIVGEVVAKKTTDNARNVAAGMVNLDDPAEAKKRIVDNDIIFVAFDSYPRESTYSQTLENLKAMGFTTLLDDLSEYPTDGFVYRIDDTEAFLAEGNTSKHPKGAFAYKENVDSGITEITNVVWQTGKTGKITPVAILEPVEVDDAVITRATLNNMTWLYDLGLRCLGSKVEVIRAGSIIPQIVKVISHGEGKEIIPPTSCPSCGDTPVQVTDQLFCRNPNCTEQLIKKVEKYCKTLRILGLGISRLKQLNLRSIEELYTLSEKDIAEKLGSEKIAATIYSNIQVTTKGVELADFIAALSIPHIGSTKAKEIALCGKTDLADITSEDCPTLGPVALESFIDFLDTGTWPDIPLVNSKKQEAAKGTVVITGKISGFTNRNALKAELEQKGYTVRSSVSKNTDYLICENPESNSSKIVKARDIGIKIVKAEELLYV